MQLYTRLLLDCISVVLNGAIAPSPTVGGEEVLRGDELVLGG